MTMLIVLHPHRSAAGSADMFVAELPDGDRLKPTRAPMYATARALQERGVPDGELLEYRHAGSAIIAARGAVGWLAKWAMSEGDRSGLQKYRYAPFSRVSVTTPLADDDL